MVSVHGLNITLEERTCKNGCGRKFKVMPNSDQWTAMRDCESICQGKLLDPELRRRKWSGSFGNIERGRMEHHHNNIINVKSIIVRELKDRMGDAHEASTTGLVICGLYLDFASKAECEIDFAAKARIVKISEAKRFYGVFSKFNEKELDKIPLAVGSKVVEEVKPGTPKIQVEEVVNRIQNEMKADLQTGRQVKNHLEMAHGQYMKNDNMLLDMDDAGFKHLHEIVKDLSVKFRGLSRMRALNANAKRKKAG